MKQLKLTKFIEKFDLILERVVTRTSYGLFDLDKSGVKQLILFENLFKPRQLRLTVYVLLTSSVLSTTSKRCFEQPAAIFIVCSLIFIEYKFEIKFIKKRFNRMKQFYVRKIQSTRKQFQISEFMFRKLKVKSVLYSSILKQGNLLYNENKIKFERSRRLQLTMGR